MIRVTRSAVVRAAAIGFITAAIAGCSSSSPRAQPASSSGVSSTDAPTSNSSTATTTAPAALTSSAVTAEVACDQRKTVWNDADQYGYILCYPANWHPSDIDYANAFEIRSYPADASGSTPESDKANLVLTDTTNDTAAATDAFLDQQLQQPNTLPADQRSLSINGHRAIRVYSERPAAQPLGGPQPTTPTASATVELLGFSLYVAVGRHVIQLDGTARADADSRVINDIKSIETMLTLLDSHP